MNASIIQFNKEQSDLLKSASLKITLENGDTYYHLPFFYKDLGNKSFQVIEKDKLPQEIKDLINPYRI